MWAFVLVLLFATAGLAQTTGASQLTLANKGLPEVVVGHPYEQTLEMQGGKGPFKWSVVEGYLPPGIQLDPNTGALTGKASMKGVYRFVVEVQDLTTHAVAKREFAIKVAGPLLLQWVTPPTLDEKTLSGKIKVTNSSERPEPFDLTVIIAAVNEIGKAFALGYQHFQLEQNSDQTIPFSSALPNGRYIVHVDAIGEVEAQNAVFRSQLQTPTPLILNVNR